MSKTPPIVKHPHHWLMGGAAYYAQRAPLKWIPKWAEEYGDVYTVTSRLGSAHIVTNPDFARQVLAEKYRHYLEKGRAYNVLKVLMGNGLVTSSGEFWRGQRKLTQPAFHRRRLEAIFTMMVERARAYAERLEKIAEPIDVAPLFSQLTLEIISRAMFSTDVESDAAHVGSYITTLNEGALKTLRHPWRLLLPRKISTPFTHREFAARTSLNSMVHQIISHRREENSGDHDDLLAMFLSACDEETGRGMTDSQLRDEVMTMFVAGHETTANAMCWLLHLVAKNPEVAAQIHDEIHQAGDALDKGDLSAFPVTRRAIEESLRIYPTIWSVGRKCVRDDQLGKYEIKAGSNLIIPIFHFHWSDQWWDQPEKFDPDRFLPENRPGPEIYFPFGAGPRTCIGNQFAMQELMILAVVFFKKFRVLPVEGFLVEPDPLITLRPKHGMTLKLESRKCCEN